MKTEAKNIDSTNTTINNTTYDKDTYSHVCQKQIFDRSTNSVLGFVVISTPTFKKHDWINHNKVVDINSKIDKLPLEYNLKRTIKGNYDEGTKPQDGKAFKLFLEGDNYKFDVYTQVHGRGWLLSHSHTIAKTLFKAYVMVIQNDLAVNEAEKDQKSPDDFSLNLD